MKPKAPIPFNFVLDYLFAVDPVVKPMFGCHAIYAGPKIVLILRDRKEHLQDNGVWLATIMEHHDSLKEEFPSMRSIALFGSGVSAWQNIPAEADDFESAVLKACDLILKGDYRIGKIPKPRKRKA